MAGSPHRIRADLYVLDRPSIPSGPKPGPPGFPAGSLKSPVRIEGTGETKERGRTPFGRWPVGESVLPNFLQRES
jgi:hypothetical protein